MGYCISMDDSDFTIKFENTGKALNSLKSLARTGIN